MIDTYKHKGLRKQLLKEIRAKGFEDERVLEAIAKVPRHLFMDEAFLQFAYEDKPFPIGSDQTISQPYTVAFQTSLLDIRKGEKVLEIGTGSGYQTAVLLELGAKVFTIERQKALYDRTRDLLPKLGYHPKFFYGDGYLGLPAFAPFDKILVTAGAPEIPQALKDQLKPGKPPSDLREDMNGKQGILVIPVGKMSLQTMITVHKTHDEQYETLEHGDFRFVPLLGDKQWE